MTTPLFPFAAIVGQDQMRLALLLASVDWRLSVLLRGDKGSGKTTAVRSLAALLPAPAPFVNIPIGATEDRLLGGLDLEQTLKGEPRLKPGLLAQAHGGVLYIDEVNLLPAHLGDALLDAAASGIHVVEREGFSASHPAEFVLLGSMNPEEGALRPQLLDRFALSVSVSAPTDPHLRTQVLHRRIAFDRDPSTFIADWSTEKQQLQSQISEARGILPTIQCPDELLAHISSTICDLNIRSLRADLAVLRAALAFAALSGDLILTPHHIDTVLALALAHRTRERLPSPPSPPPPPPPPPSPSQSEATSTPSTSTEQIFPIPESHAPALQAIFPQQQRGQSSTTDLPQSGPVIGTRRTDTPTELDLRATLLHSLANNGTPRPSRTNLHEKIRATTSGTRYLFLIDSSGSHAAQARMRSVKGAIASLLRRSFQHHDEVALIAFRGTSAQLLLEPTPILDDALTALEYLPTGGRTPLAHALQLAQSYLTPSTLLILLTDGRANVPLHSADPWQDALNAATALTATSLLVDTEASPSPATQSLAQALNAHHITLAQLSETDALTLTFPPR